MFTSATLPSSFTPKERLEGEGLAQPHTFLSSLVNQMSPGDPGLVTAPSNPDPQDKGEECEHFKVLSCGLVDCLVRSEC